ncbi:MAG: ribonuclease J [Leptospirales bacterium]
MDLQENIKPENSDQQLRLKPDKTYFLFGGGVGRFGQNFTVFQNNGFTLWIDTGAGFPAYDQPGLQRTIPSYDIVKKFPPNVIILTHAHEDHIGAFTFLYDLIPANTPVYASPFTLSMLKTRLKELDLAIDKFSFRIVDQNAVFTEGPFRLSSFFMPHSIPQTFSVGIETPEGKKIYFSSDFKIHGVEKRHSPKDIKKYGPVDYLFCDSTGSLSSGSAPDETEVIKGLEKTIRNWEGRIFITTFSSQIERIRYIYEIAEKTGRPVGIRGRSIRVHLQAAFESEEFPKPSTRLNNPSPQNARAIWIVAGCQADEGSSFRRLAENELSKLHCTSKDLLIYSGSIIPSNTEYVYEALNNIALRGTPIVGIADEHPVVHTSGHARKDDLRKLIDWVKPETIIPVHGDPIHFQGVAELVPKSSQVKVLTEGTLYELCPDFNRIVSFDSSPGLKEPGELHFDPSLYRHRRSLSTSGICNVIIQENSWELVRLQYVGTGTKNFIQKHIPDLETKIKEVLKANAASESLNANKKLQQKIAKINLVVLQKNPFINIIRI